MYGCVYCIVNCTVHPKEGELRMLTSSLNARNETMSFFLNNAVTVRILSTLVNAKRTKDDQERLMVE